MNYPNTWNLKRSESDRKILSVLLNIIKFLLVIIATITNIVALMGENIVIVILIDIITTLALIFTVRMEKLFTTRIEIINSIIYKINKKNERITIGNICQITSIKRGIIGIYVLKDNNELFYFNIMPYNDSKEFYKYLTYSVLDNLTISQSDIKITSYKRYNYFFHFIIILGFIFLGSLFILGILFLPYPLGMKIFCLIYFLLIFFSLINEINYILYTLFKLKACSFNINKEQINFSILKVSPASKKRFNPTYSSSSSRRNSKGYKGILIKEDVCLKYEDVVDVDFVINLDMRIPASYLTHFYLSYRKGLDIVIITKDKNYFILSDLFSRKDMDIIYRELKGRIKGTNF